MKKRKIKETIKMYEEAKNGEGLYHNLLIKIEGVIKSSMKKQDKIDIIAERIKITHKEHSKMSLAYELFNKDKIKINQLYKSFNLSALDLI